MKPRALRLLSVLPLTALAACGSLLGSRTTEESRAALQQRDYPVAMAAVFRTLRDLLQAEGHVLRQQDARAGHFAITLNTDELPAPGPSEENLPGEHEDLTVLVTRVGAVTRIRLSLQRLARHTLGGVTGYEILDPIPYQEIFRKLDAELGRKPASGKK